MNLKYDIQEGYLILTVEMGYADSSSVMIPLKKLAKGVDKHITHPKPVACKCKCEDTKVKTPRRTVAKKESKD